MPRINLTKEKILEEAFILIHEEGYEKFNLQTLSSRLQIKPPSLYKHVKNLEEIVWGVTTKIISHYNDYKREAVLKKQKDEALVAYANAVREYAQIYPDYFKLLMLFPVLRGGNSSIHSPLIVEELLKILIQYNVPQERIYHLQRVFRSTILGFISCENAGFFHDDSIDKEESFNIAITSFIAALKLEEQNNK